MIRKQQDMRSYGAVLALTARSSVNRGDVDFELGCVLGSDHGERGERKGGSDGAHRGCV